MNILLTGGSGFIGNHLVPALLSAGHQVTILTRNSRNDPRKRMDYLVWDGKSMPLGIGRYDAIINLAGASIGRFRWTAASKADIMQSRIDATRACVEYIQQSPTPPSVFISASGIGYYGTKYTEEIHERSRPGTDFPAQVTIAWEAEAQKATTRTVIPRLGVVLGDGGALDKMIPIYRWYLGGTLGGGSQGFPWIHIEDVVQVFLFFLENESISGPVNVVAPQIITQKRFSDALAEILEVKAPWPIPKFLLQLLMGEASLLLWGGQKAIPRVLQREKFRFQFPDIKPALADLFAD